jgi:hypothetical protein
VGWGCYKHEMDAGSEQWIEDKEALIEKKLAQKPKTFGRDGEICPRCFIEIEKALKFESKKTVNNFKRYIRHDNYCDYLKPIKSRSIALPCSCGLDNLISEIEREG